MADDSADVLRSALRQVREIATKALAELDRQESASARKPPRVIPYTPESLVERWQCSANHVRKMITRGELPAFSVGKLLRMSVAAVEELSGSTEAAAN